MSSPKLPVPKGCVNDGEARMSEGLSSYDPYGAISGASTAIAIKPRMIAKPAAVTGLRRDQRPTRTARSASPLRPRAAAAAIALNGPSCRSRAAADARVDDEVEDVDEQEEKDVDRRRVEDESLHGGVVARRDRVEDVAAEPRPREDLLDEHDAAE